MGAETTTDSITKLTSTVTSSSHSPFHKTDGDRKTRQEWSTEKFSGWSAASCSTGDVSEFAMTASECNHVLASAIYDRLRDDTVGT